MAATRMTGLFIGVVLTWWLYDLQFHWRELQEYHYGWVVPALAGYIVLVRWEGRPTRDAIAPFWVSMCLAGVGIPFVVVAELYKRAITHTPASSFCLSIGCFLFLPALILWGRGHRTLLHFLFPLCFLFLAVPLPGILWNPIVMVLREIITRLDVECLNLIGIPAFQQVNVIQLPGSAVGVNDACSGVRSLQRGPQPAVQRHGLAVHRIPELFENSIQSAVSGDRYIHCVVRKFHPIVGIVHCCPSAWFDRSGQVPRCCRVGHPDFHPDWPHGVGKPVETV